MRIPSTPPRRLEAAGHRVTVAYSPSRDRQTGLCNEIERVLETFESMAL